MRTIAVVTNNYKTFGSIVRNIRKDKEHYVMASDTEKIKGFYFDDVIRGPDWNNVPNVGEILYQIELHRKVKEEVKQEYL